MNKMHMILIAGTLATLGAVGAQAGDDDRFQPVPQLQGVWQTKVTVVDCVSGNRLAGPFPGLISFQAGGTINESGPSLPGTSRGVGFGIWSRTGRNTFAQTLMFQRFDASGIYLGTQVIRATPQVANDSKTFVGIGGTYEVKDQMGSTLATGCSAGSGTRIK